MCAVTEIGRFDPKRGPQERLENPPEPKQLLANHWFPWQPSGWLAKKGQIFALGPFPFFFLFLPFSSLWKTLKAVSLTSTSPASGTYYIYSEKIASIGVAAHLIFCFFPVQLCH